MKTTNLLTVLSLCTAFVMSTSCERDEPIAPEVIPSDGTQMTLQGGEGAGDAINAVYVDLSTDKQTSVKRDSWSLGFHSGSAFRVIINNQIGYAARVTDQTDINAVNSTNTDIDVLAQEFDPSKMVNYDDTAGRIEKTVIAEIKDNETDNKVYIVNTKFASEVAKEDVWKIRVLKNGDAGYTLQYAKIDATDFQTASINKDQNYNFKFFSFTSGPVDVEPTKEEWDFVWTKTVFYSSMGPNIFVPYTFSDMIFLNHLPGQVSASLVNSEEINISYADFAEADLSKVSLETGRNVIGASWRKVPSPGIDKKLFYIIKDSAGNIYKLKFIAMGAKVSNDTDAATDGGIRGYPELEYKLLKRG